MIDANKLRLEAIQARREAETAVLSPAVEVSRTSLVQVENQKRDGSRAIQATAKTAKRTECKSRITQSA